MSGAPSTPKSVLPYTEKQLKLTHNSVLKILPQDCWVQILDEISPSDAASVVATSRGLQVSSESSLYRQVDIDWTGPPLSGS